MVGSSTAVAVVVVFVVLGGGVFGGGGGFVLALVAASVGLIVRYSPSMGLSVLVTSEITTIYLYYIKCVFMPEPSETLVVSNRG